MNYQVSVDEAFGGCIHAKWPWVSSLRTHRMTERQEESIWSTLELALKLSLILDDFCTRHYS